MQYNEKKIILNFIANNKFKQFGNWTCAITLFSKNYFVFHKKNSAMNKVLKVIKRIFIVLHKRGPVQNSFLNFSFNSLFESIEFSHKTERKFHRNAIYEHSHMTRNAEVILKTFFFASNLFVFIIQLVFFVRNLSINFFW